jgi:hypothetical protein
LAATRRAKLLRFETGGLSFAVEADSLHSIEGGQWRPAAQDDELINQDDELINNVSLAKVLDLAGSVPRRTLVIEMDSGLFGFAVDAVAEDVLGDYTVHDLPALLVAWLKPVVLCGLARVEDKALLNVIDLRLLAHHLASGQLDGESGELHGAS